MHDDHDHDHDLAHDLATTASRRAERRAVLRWGGGAGLAALWGCASDDSSSGSGGSASGSGGSSGSGACPQIPEETGGPYPGDGTNGPNVLTESGVVRTDLRSSFGGLSGTAAGVPLTLVLSIVDIAGGCVPAAGYAIYLWHCDREGRYSLYSSGVTDQNYLRGVQESDEDGKVTFTTIFPACYDGRWPHIHFEAYASLADATDAGNRVATSQLALAADACDEVYATEGYEQSVRNFAATSLASDNVFRDGAELETPVITGNVTDGFTATISIAVG
jgi:protocatechuate 3,4-dioxygenase beta subunit